MWDNFSAIFPQIISFEYLFLSRDVSNCLHKIAVAEGMPKYTIQTNVASKHDENFMSFLNAVTLTNADTSEQLHLIWKSPSQNEARREHFKLASVFRREIDVYTKLLPAFVQFQQEKAICQSDSFLSFPKLYAHELDTENGNYLLIILKCGQKIKRCH